MQIAVRAKANQLYPQPGAEIPKASTAIAEAEVDFNKRLAVLANQQAKLTQSLNLADGLTPVDLGNQFRILYWRKKVPLLRLCLQNIQV